VSFLRAGFLAAGLFLAAGAQAQQGPFTGPPASLQELDLSAAQQEHVLRIFQEQVPALRARVQAARLAHEELEQLAIAGRLDSEAARGLAEVEDEALYEVSQMRVEAMRQVYRLLTQEQQGRAVLMNLER
jgi:Spy/CpxP family protein refolding chaperone